jgi:hypothetical protein
VTVVSEAGMTDWIQALIYTAVLTLFVICLRIWNDPATLVKWADRIETYGMMAIRVTVRAMRVRAAAKADSQRVYRMAHAWYQKVL